MDKSEDNLVAWIRKRYGTSDLPIGIGDDMAMLPKVEGERLVTSDMLMDGVDFVSRVHSPEQIGRKALAVSLSDCAAMAVRPRWVIVSVALPNAWSMEKAQRLYQGMEPLLEKYDCKIVGGDTNSWDNPLVIDVTIIAEGWEGVRPVRRNGMRSGDRIHVTGLLGGSLSGRHLDFEPRVQEARGLAGSLGSALHAMIDLSDGLSIDAARLAASSNCAIEIDEASLAAVISDAAEAAFSSDGRSPLDHALNDGEDFELLFAASSPAAQAGLSVTQIGVAFSGEGLWLRRVDGSRERIEPKGWQHFKS